MNTAFDYFPVIPAAIAIVEACWVIPRRPHGGCVVARICDGRLCNRGIDPRDGDSNRKSGEAEGKELVEPHHGRQKAEQKSYR